MTLSTATLDHLLTAQLLVAWAGESGDEPRLAWWGSNLTGEFGGEDLFQRLLPATWRWAALEGAREAARRTDAQLRARAHDADTLYTLFRFGFAVDERLDERLRDLKSAGAAPVEALPGLRPLLERPFDRATFAGWVDRHGPVEVVTTPAGRRIRSAAATLEARADRLVGALAPIPTTWPLPHFTGAPHATGSPS